MDELISSLASKITKLEGNQLTIGDILLTPKSQKGDEWMRCDGREIDPDYYPILSNVLDITFDQAVDSKILITGTTDNCQNTQATYCNPGVFRYCRGDDGGQYLKITTGKYVYTSTNFRNITNETAAYICYVDGQYRKLTVNTNGAISIQSKTNVGSAWGSSVTLKVPYDEYDTTGSLYAFESANNGYYALAYKSQSVWRIHQWSSLNSSSHIQKQLDDKTIFGEAMGSKRYVKTQKYHVFLGFKSENRYTDSLVKIAYTENLGTAFTVISFSDLDIYNCYKYGFGVSDTGDQIWMIGQRRDYNGTRVLFVNLPTGSRQFFDVPGYSTTGYGLASIVYFKGKKYFIPGIGSSASTTFECFKMNSSDKSPFYLKSADGQSLMGLVNSNIITLPNNDILIALGNKGATTGSLYRISANIIPNIKIGGVNAFIKAK